MLSCLEELTIPKTLTDHCNNIATNARGGGMTNKPKFAHESLRRNRVNSLTTVESSNERNVHNNLFSSENTRPKFGKCTSTIRI